MKPAVACSRLGVHNSAWKLLPHASCPPPLCLSTSLSHFPFSGFPLLTTLSLSAYTLFRVVSSYPFLALASLVMLLAFPQTVSSWLCSPQTPPPPCLCLPRAFTVSSLLLQASADPFTARHSLLCLSPFHHPGLHTLPSSPALHSLFFTPPPPSNLLLSVPARQAHVSSCMAHLCADNTSFNARSFAAQPVRFYCRDASAAAVHFPPESVQSSTPFVPSDPNFLFCPQ